MVGKVLKIHEDGATVRVAREGKGCLTCKRECAMMQGEPTVEVQAVPGLCVGQVVHLADRRRSFWWLKAAVFVVVFLLTAWVVANLLHAVGLGAPPEKLAIGAGLVGGGIGWLLAQQFVRKKRQYAITRILEVANNAGKG
jgi:positive regulator of sigma E activity